MSNRKLDLLASLRDNSISFYHNYYLDGTQGYKTVGDCKPIITRGVIPKSCIGVFENLLDELIEDKLVERTSKPSGLSRTYSPKEYTYTIRESQL